MQSRATTSTRPSPTSSMSGIAQNVFGYGNYYTWAAAKANITAINTMTNGNNTATSICPSGWRLPYGGSGSTRDFSGLTNSLGGAKDTNNNALTMDDTTSPTGVEMSTILRKYPNNLIMSGEVYDVNSNVVSRGTTAYYWTAAAYTESKSLGLTFSGVSIYPGNASGNKASGRSVRCVIGS